MKRTEKPIGQFFTRSSKLGIKHSLEILRKLRKAGYSINPYANTTRLKDNGWEASMMIKPKRLTIAILLNLICLCNYSSDFRVEVALPYIGILS